jgi:hypothetical protein
MNSRADQRQRALPVALIFGQSFRITLRSQKLFAPPPRFSAHVTVPLGLRAAMNKDFTPTPLALLIGVILGPDPRLLLQLRRPVARRSSWPSRNSSAFREAPPSQLASPFGFGRDHRRNPEPRSRRHRQRRSRRHARICAVGSFSYLVDVFSVLMPLGFHLSAPRQTGAGKRSPGGNSDGRTTRGGPARCRRYPCPYWRGVAGIPRMRCRSCRFRRGDLASRLYV